MDRHLRLAICATEHSVTTHRASILAQRPPAAIAPSFEFMATNIRNTSPSMMRFRHTATYHPPIHAKLYDLDDRLANSLCSATPLAPDQIQTQLR